jgi:hypothetical protein
MAALRVGEDKVVAVGPHRRGCRPDGPAASEPHLHVLPDVEVAYELKPTQRRASSPDRAGVTEVTQATGFR